MHLAHFGDCGGFLHSASALLSPHSIVIPYYRVCGDTQNPLVTSSTPPASTCQRPPLGHSGDYYPKG